MKGIRSVNADMSNDKLFENYNRRKPKIFFVKD